MAHVIQKTYFINTHGEKPEDILDTLVVCPNCGKVVKYGELMMHSGYSGCPDCFDSLTDRIEKIRKSDYDSYCNLNLYSLDNAQYDERVKKVQMGIDTNWVMENCEEY